MTPTKNTMFLFLCVLVAAMAVLPGGRGAVLPPVNLLGPTLINGTVFCTLTGNNGPPFKNATVELRCGPGIGSPISAAVTNSTGKFAIKLNRLPYTIPQVLANCHAVVITPLKKCNSTLPSFGFLTSKLALNGTIPQKPVNVTVFTAKKFSYSLRP